MFHLQCKLENKHAVSKCVYVCVKEKDSDSFLWTFISLSKSMNILVIKEKY